MDYSRGGGIIFQVKHMTEIGSYILQSRLCPKKEIQMETQMEKCNISCQNASKLWVWCTEEALWFLK